MKFLGKIRAALIFLFFCVFLLIVGVIGLSTFSDWDTISVYFGSGNLWTSGTKYYSVYIGGLGNPSLAVGLISASLSLIFFILFLIFNILAYKGFARYMRLLNPNKTEPLKKEPAKLVSTPKNDFVQKIDQLIALKAEGHITEEEFETVKAKLVAEVMNQ